MIHLFNVTEVPALSQVGGKAKALIETTQAGFNVPEGFVLSVDFFETWQSEIKGSPIWQAFLDNPNKEMCDALKAMALKLTFSDNQKEAIDNALVEVGDIKVFAVRSSSPEEDLEGKSFAGQYESILGVKATDLESAVVKAFVSMLDTRVVEYKKFNNLPIDNPRIAVVVQKQIASDASGVGFSLNPLNNCYDEVVINASFGLGEAIVSGVVTPDTYIVDSIKNEVIEKKVVEKKLALWLKAEGGIEQRENSNADQQALTDTQIMELSALIKKCEAHYKIPMDTEWAYEAGKLYLLQSRPITTYLPFFPELLTNPGEQKMIYLDMIYTTQGFNNQMSLLGMGLWGKMLESVQGETVRLGIDGTLPTLHGRLYVNVSYMYKAMGGLFTKEWIKAYDKNVTKIFDDLDLSAYVPSKKPAQLKGMLRKSILSYFKMIPPMVKTMFLDYKTCIESYKKTANRIMATADKVNVEDDILVTADTLMKELKLIMAEVGALLAGMLSLSKIKKMFKGYEVETLVAALGMDLVGNPTSAMGHLMYKLACYDEFISTASVEEFLIKLGEKAYSNEFMTDYDDFMEKHGMRGFMEIDIAAKRTYDDPGILFKNLKSININDNQITKVKEKKQQAYEEMLSIAKEKGFEKKFKKHAEIYQETFGYREYNKYIVVYLFSKIRTVCLEIGEEFVSVGRLEEKTQIFDLHLHQISRAQKDFNVNLMQLREKNLEPYKRVAHIRDWPLVIDSRGKIFKPKMEIKDGDIVGEPIAPGKVQGRAKILHSPYEKTLNLGEILVTTATEPSWTPIFINAAGVIMEVGGPLQHGCIIAREYGIPCVSGLMGIMDMVKDGDLIEVDGSNGIVRILETT